MDRFRFGWDRSMDTGVEEIDIQHRRILQLIKHVHERPEGHARAALDELRRQLRVHYACEEALLEHYAEGDIDRHRGEHRTSLAAIDELLGQLEIGRISRQELCTTLYEWLVDHTRDADLPLLKPIVRLRDLV